jgi:hypothetical protein
MPRSNLVRVGGLRLAFESNYILQLPSSISSPDNSTKQSCLTSQNKPTIHTLPNSQPLTNTHISDNCHLFATTNKMNSTKTSQNNIHANNDTIDFSHACENSNNNPLSPISDNSYTRQITTNQQNKHSMTSLTPQYHITDNTHLDKKQMQTINRTTQN